MNVLKSNYFQAFFLKGHRPIADHGSVGQEMYGADEMVEPRKILILTSSLHTDRILRHTELLTGLGEFAVHIWTTAPVEQARDLGERSRNVVVEALPSTKRKPSFLFPYVRALNDFISEYQIPLPSRLSKIDTGKTTPRRSIRMLRPLGRVCAKLRLAGVSNELYKAYIRRQSLDHELLRKVKEIDPEIVVVTGPHRSEEPPIATAAKYLGIPTIAYFTSWDNLSTKSRMGISYDGYIVWSDSMRDELQKFYPDSKTKPIYLVGAPQFDVFFSDRFRQTRVEFCQEAGLDPTLPIVVYALGSPNGFQEYHGANWLAHEVSKGSLGRAQLLIRPHPIFESSKLREMFSDFPGQVKVQYVGGSGAETNKRFQDEDQIRNWINTFRHADVVINLSSTVTVDAAIFDKPTINLNFDPHPEQPFQKLVKDINSIWTHFGPIATSGGVVLVNNYQELLDAVRSALNNSDEGRDRRAWIVSRVCGNVNGAAATRMSNAISEFARRVGRRPLGNQRPI